MSDRIDHAAEARKLLAAAHGSITLKAAKLNQREAQVHATLALVEQQRIASVIALSVKQPLLSGGEVWVSSFGRDGLLLPGIREALGL